MRGGATPQGRLPPSAAARAETLCLHSWLPRMGDSQTGVCLHFILINSELSGDDQMARK